MWLWAWMGRVMGEINEEGGKDRGGGEIWDVPFVKF